MNELFAAFAHAPHAVFWLSAEGRIVDCNAAAATRFGLTPADLRGRLFATLLDPFSIAKAQTMIEQTLREGGVQHWELDHLRVGEPPFLLGYTTWLLRDEAGAVCGVIALGLDLGLAMTLAAQLAAANQQLEATLKQLEHAHAELKAAQTQLVQSEKMRSLGQLVAGVAHEINTPLGYVANNLAFLAERLPALRAAPTDELGWRDVTDAIRESQTGIERIAAIVRALRVFARPDEDSLVPADVNEGLASTVRMVRAVSGPRVTIHEEYAQVPRVLCHPGELNQVFLNLLLNAVHACRGTGTVIAQTMSDGTSITVTIRDTGIGMDAATLARLGEPFFTTWPDGEGTGLGLAISREIVARHGGQLRFQSEPGRGTTVEVILPVGTL
ncbi:sensor histidine kinase [Chloroflexus aggregans]|uniref:histidine kinase n=1 Tax=Chloroflexus aggregans (strain MD-66 / DSM 9485) TaxID=326427 RepID=B8G5R9_CHLAD|nr:ATP-binding protein [Chloroflexus aggregans]ACL23780.1 PAS/PAC sensor signal transduction histidine kinase [Chloroflexus aggregans DSM 9485]